MGARRWVDEAERLDVAALAAVARTDAPGLDRAMRARSRAADHSVLWMGAAGALAPLGGPTGRRAAAGGLVSIAVTSALVDVALKPLGRRRRPGLAARGVPLARQVRMPLSASFPSGHAASAFAFATGVSATRPAAAPLHALAAAVAYSRVHTGVHFPGDVAVGGLLGVALARITVRVRERRRA